MNPIPRIEAELPIATSRSWFEERLKETVTYAKELEKQIEGHKLMEKMLLARCKRAENVLRNPVFGLGESTEKVERCERYLKDLKGEFKDG